MMNASQTSLGQLSELSLVPKLCLGTDVRETLFRTRLARNRSFGGVRSQTEFGNERNSNFSPSHLADEP
jgi:hypothetical protein